MKMLITKHSHASISQVYLSISKITPSNSRYYIEGAIVDYKEHLSYIPEAEDRAEIEIQIAKVLPRLFWRNNDSEAVGLYLTAYVGDPSHEQRSGTGGRCSV